MVQLLGAVRARVPHAIADCIVVEVEILVSWPAGAAHGEVSRPSGDLELSDSLRHCLDEDVDGYC